MIEPLSVIGLVLGFAVLALVSDKIESRNKKESK